MAKTKQKSNFSIQIKKKWQMKYYVVLSFLAVFEMNFLSSHLIISAFIICEKRQQNRNKTRKMLLNREILAANR